MHEQHSRERGHAARGQCHDAGRVRMAAGCDRGWRLVVFFAATSCITAIFPVHLYVGFLDVCVVFFVARLCGEGTSPRSWDVIG